MEIREFKSQKTMWRGIIEEYREFLPVGDTTPIITLHEGNTPLIKATNLRQRLGFDFELFLKFDGANPTGSFKDRGMTLALSKALEHGAKAIICASTGNTSASAEGIFCEPASAAALAGVIKLQKEKFFRPHAHVVCTLTGSGLKDPDTVLKVAKEPLRVDAMVSAVEKALEGIV